MPLLLKKIHLGTIIAAHGLRGEVKIKSFAGAPEAIGAYGRLWNETGDRSFSIKVRSVNKDVVIAALEGVADRNQSEALAKAKTRLFVDRAAFGEAEDGRYFIEDIRDLRALDETGAERGVVADILNFGAGDIVVIRDRGREFLLPFKPPFAHAPDFEKGTLQVSIPDGWLDDEKPPRGDAEEEG